MWTRFTVDTLTDIDTPVWLCFDITIFVQNQLKWVGENGLKAEKTGSATSQILKISQTYVEVKRCSISSSDCVTDKLDDCQSYCNFEY